MPYDNDVSFLRRKYIKHKNNKTKTKEKELSHDKFNNNIKHHVINIISPDNECMKNILRYMFEYLLCDTICYIIFWMPPSNFTWIRNEVHFSYELNVISRTLSSTNT